MALICARAGSRTGEPGRASDRLTRRSRLARSSSPAVRPLASCLRIVISSPDGRVASRYSSGPQLAVARRSPCEPGPDHTARGAAVHAPLLGQSVDDAQAVRAFLVGLALPL